MFGSDVFDRSSLRKPGIGDDDVNDALLGFDRFSEFAYVLELRKVSSDRRDMSSDLRGSLVELALTPRRDKDVRALLHESLRGRETDPAVSARYNCNLSV